MAVKSSKEKEKLLKHNNWGGKLPDDHYSPVSGEPRIRSGWFRESVDRNGRIDLVIGIRSSNKEGHSELYLRQTYREFFLTIDRLIVEMGVKEILDNYLELARNMGIEEHVWKSELERITQPVIQKMLEMGYTEHDLGS